MDKFKELNLRRRALREEILAKMKESPSMDLSETLRKLDDDIEFWEAQTDHSLEGTLKTLQESLKRY